MCFYYAIVKEKTDSIKNSGILNEKQLELIDNHYIVNGFNHPEMPVISSENPEKIEKYFWGFVPGHIRSKEQADQFIEKYNTLNARGENIFQSRLYKNSIKTKRCLVLCSGFFEWRHKTINKKTVKYPFYIALKNDEMFVFGGI